MERIVLQVVPLGSFLDAPELTALARCSTRLRREWGGKSVPSVWRDLCHQRWPHASAAREQQLEEARRGGEVPSPVRKKRRVEQRAYCWKAFYISRHRKQSNEKLLGKLWQLLETSRGAVGEDEAGERDSDGVLLTILKEAPDDIAKVCESFQVLGRIVYGAKYWYQEYIYEEDEEAAYSFGIRLTEVHQELTEGRDAVTELLLSTGFFERCQSPTEGLLTPTSMQPQQCPENDNPRGGWRGLKRDILPSQLVDAGRVFGPMWGGFDIRFWREQQGGEGASSGMSKSSCGLPLVPAVAPSRVFTGKALGSGDLLRSLGLVMKPKL